MHELVQPHAQVTTIGRFQALQAGQYWKALEELPGQGITSGTVLLIQSIRWVDEKPHTVVLRPHPSLIGKRVEVEVPQDDGETATFDAPSPFATHRGRAIEHLRITAAGRTALAPGGHHGKS